MQKDAFPFRVQIFLSRLIRTENSRMRIKRETFIVTNVVLKNIKRYKSLETANER